MSPRRVLSADKNAGTPHQSIPPVQSPPAGRSTPPKAKEAFAWRNITGTWQPLYGSFFQQGISVEWHDFTLAEDIDWSRSFHPGGLEICLNFSGAARLHDGTAVRDLPPGTLAIYTTREQAPSAVRLSGTVHRFLTLEVAPEYLRTQCTGQLELLKSPLRRFVREGGACAPYLEVCPLTTGLLGVRQELIEPPVPASARSAWYRAKVLEVLAQTVFCDDAEGELFCTRYKRQNRARVERARYLLERDLENPPSLDMLAEDVECSPFYLSRIFAEEVGMGIPKFLRMLRIERAADLLRTGRMSVTEVAFTVGYSSLSAFNRAFVELKGCCPGLYPKVKIAGRQATK
jgi:AraC family transcriptional regulator